MSNIIPGPNNQLITASAAPAYGDGKYILLSDGWEQDVNPQAKLTIE